MSSFPRDMANEINNAVGKRVDMLRPSIGFRRYANCHGLAKLHGLVLALGRSESNNESKMTFSQLRMVGIVDKALRIRVLLGHDA